MIGRSYLYGDVVHYSCDRGKRINQSLTQNQKNEWLPFLFFKATSWKGLKVESALRMGLGLDQILSAKVK